MTDPTTYRQVAGMDVPLEMVPRILAALAYRYPDAVAGVDDPDARVRAALKAWVVESLADFEEKQAMAGLPIKVAQTVATFETKAAEAKQKAIEDATSQIVETPDNAVTSAP